MVSPFDFAQDDKERRCHSERSRRVTGQGYPLIQCSFGRDTLYDREVKTMIYHLMLITRIIFSQVKNSVICLTQVTWGDGVTL